jgi:hypothetical protein
MRSFLGDELFEPVERPRPDIEAGSVPERLKRFWPKGGRLKPGPARIMMSAGSLGLILFTYQSFQQDGVSIGALALGLFTLLWVCVSVLTELRAFQDRRIAVIMHGASATASTTNTAPPTLHAPGSARLAPPIRLDIYLQNELPALRLPYITPVGAEHNIIGLAPRRILYLYNFFSGAALAQKVKGNWRRFGPLYFLGSPADISFRHTFDWRIGASVAPAILATPESFDARFASADENVLAPGDKSLTDISHFSGGYPQNLFLCSDGSWRHAVARLFDHADIVLLDACDYDAQRAGLRWEIGQLVDRVPLHNVAVLVDEGTDQPALCAAFRSAWAAMDDSSPNNRPSAGPVRWVVLASSDERKAQTPRPLPPEADPLGLYKKFNPILKSIIGGHYDDALLDDRIFGLLISTETVASASST